MNTHTYTSLHSIVYITNMYAIFYHSILYHIHVLFLDCVESAAHGYTRCMEETLWFLRNSKYFDALPQLSNHLQATLGGIQKRNYIYTYIAML